MQQISEFLRNADECLKMAGKTRNETLREQFFDLAHEWVRLAAARDQTLRLSVANPG